MQGSVDMMTRDCSSLLGMSVSGLYTAQGDLVHAVSCLVMYHVQL